MFGVEYEMDGKRVKFPVVNKLDLPDLGYDIFQVNLDPDGKPMTTTTTTKKKKKRKKKKKEKIESHEHLLVRMPNLGYNQKITIHVKFATVASWVDDKLKY